MTHSDEAESEERRGYSAAMISRLAGVHSSTVRRWVRRGYLRPLDERGLASFGFEQLHVARRLSALAAAGLTPSRIDRLVEQLCSAGDEPARVLTGLQFRIDGEHVLVQQDGSWFDPSGQLRLGFDQGESSQACENPRVAIPFGEPRTELELLRLRAEELLDLQELTLAEEAYRAVLFTGRGTAADQLALADILYRRGDLSAARERYLVCLEADEACLEARLSLGSLYAELGSLDLAVAALEGVLEMAPDSPDALIQLADLMDRQGKPGEACRLRRHLVAVAPEGPWSDQARARLEQAVEGAEQLENPGH